MWLGLGEGMWARSVLPCGLRLKGGQGELGISCDLVEYTRSGGGGGGMLAWEGLDIG